MRDQNGVQYLYGDNVGSVRGWSNKDGTSYAKRTACGSQRPRSVPWGEDGTSTQYGSAGKAISDRKYTGQKSLASLGIYDYQARYYDPYLNRFLQPDSIIPDPYNPLSYDRYAYVRNSPTNFNDPTGHEPVPPNDPNQIIRDAVAFFQGIGYTVVGEPTVKSIHSNGTDIVLQKIKESEVIETVCVEVKNITKGINLGAFAKDTQGFREGSILHNLRTAERLSNTSKPQLKMEFEAIQNGSVTGNLKNALYTSAGKVSEGAKDIFNYVYATAANGAVATVKAVEIITTTTVDIPFIAVPYFLIDPKNSPLKTLQIQG